MDNPFMKRGQNDKGGHGRRIEKHQAKSLKARLTPGSGSLDGAKGDMEKKTAAMSLLIESKSTYSESMSLKHSWLKKITREAKDRSKVPMLLVTFVTETGHPKDDGEWVMIPKSIANLIDDLR
jgi:hypothetical protein